MQDNDTTAIAIIGMAGRFPGARDIGQFWGNLCAGVESIRRLDDAELRAAGVSEALAARADYVRSAAPLDDCDEFAAEFFGYSPKQAQITDPQHRIFMECSWEAIEDAGYAPAQLPGKVGVYAGSGLNTYLLHCLLPQVANVADSMGMLPLIIGNKSDFMVSQVAHRLNLKGPAVAVNTACSTSLVAVHMACQSLLNYETDLALAGGVSVQVPQTGGYLYQSGGVFSADGRCRPFDADAGGTVPGNGAGVVLLKRLDEALADGDRIYALIRGSASNNDGARKIGFTAPSVEGQHEVIASAMALAGLRPEQIDYIEAHGTATSLGDPLELKALAQAYAGAIESGASWQIGSLKSNVGHLDAAAGVAGLIKAALCLKHRQLVPTVNFSTPNPAFDPAAAAFGVNTECRPWPSRSDGEPLRAAVSSFGIGGTNAHVVLEAAPAAVAAPAMRAWQLLALSAENGDALDAMSRRLGERLAGADSDALADVAYTLQLGRTSFAQRRVLLCETRADATATLADRDPQRCIAGVAGASPSEVAFLFPGIGEQYVGMARGLYDEEPAFRDALDECARLLRDIDGTDLLGGLYPRGALTRVATGTGSGAIDLRALMGRDNPSSDPDQARLRSTSFAHPALFAVEYALARLWMSWGLQPNAMLGHSLGEYVAACVAGVMSLIDAISVVSKRAALIQGLPEGAMLGVAMSGELLRPWLPQDVSVAATNTDGLCVASGPVEAIEQLRAALDGQGIASRRVNSSHAFHSRMLEPIRAPLAALFRDIELKPPAIPYLSNLSGDWIEDTQATDPDYWAAHTCGTVRFGEGLDKLRAAGVAALLEVGPGQSLGGFALQQAPAEERDRLVAVASLPSLHEGSADAFVAARSLAALWCVGAQIDWNAYHRGASRGRVGLPTYPFQRQRYWIAPVVGAGGSSWTTPMESQIMAAPAAAAATVQAAGPSRAYLPPEGEIEQLMAELWIDILGVRQVGRDDHFLQLGGSSLLAVRLMTKLRERIDVALPIRSLFERPTLRAISALVEDVILAEIENASEADVLSLLGEDGGAADPTDIEPTLLELPNKMQVLQFNRVETDHFYHDIFETQVYARNGIEIPEDAIVLDIGANIGLFSLFVRERASNARIYAFEPAPPVFNVLRANLASAGNRVTLFNAGVSDRCGTQRLTYYPRSTGMSSFHADKDEEKQVLRAIINNQLSSDEEGAREMLGSVEEILDMRFREQSFDCPMRTVSDVVREHAIARIDLMKIDVQKAERAVIEGIESQHWPLIRQVVVEVHDLEGRVEEVRILLEGKGFLVRVEQDELYENSSIFNLYAIRH